MSDLISRKALLEDMKHFCRGNCRNCDYSTFLASDEHCGLIDRQPTAYDPDKIVEQIHEYFRTQVDIRTEGMVEVPAGLINDLFQHNKKVCKIVKGGAV